MKTLSLLTLFITISFLTSCSTKVTVKSLQPAKISSPDIKTIIVDDIKNDNVGLTYTIRSKMSNMKFDNKTYFTLVNRNQDKRILEEQRLMDSGLIDTNTDTSYTLKEAKSILSGAIIGKSVNRYRKYETRTNYDKCLQYMNKDKKACKIYEKYNVLCVQREFILSSHFDILKITNGKTLYSNNFTKLYKDYHCEDRASNIESQNKIFVDLSNEIANDFIKTIAPSYTYTQVELLDDEDIHYNDNNQQLLKNSIELIENNNIQEANELLLTLTENTNYKSYVALYNLAITYEALGNFKNAYKYITRAKDITLATHMNKDVISAYNRIKRELDSYTKASKQISK